MIQEIFIVENKEDLITELKPYMKCHKGIVLKHIPTRHFRRLLVRWSSSCYYQRR